MRTNVTVANDGEFAEIFNITIYASTTSIQTQSFSLGIGQSAIVSFTWNTTGFIFGNYTTIVYVSPVPGETNTANNLLTDGSVILAIPGDVRGDGTVDIYDAISIARAFNSTLNGPNWNANADINDDNVVDKYDAIILADNYLQHYP